MSLDIFVYSPNDKPIDVCSLRRVAAAEGWELLVVREWCDWSSFRVVADGPLMNGDELCGWPRKDPRSPGIGEALAKRLDKEIERLFLNDALGACAFYVSSSDDFFFSGLSEAERQAVIKHNSPDEYRATFLDGVFNPKLIYTLNMRVAAGSVSGEFFDQIGRWIARICGGAWEDPQSGDQQLFTSPDQPT
jgi:hypothetical protein